VAYEVHFSGHGDRPQLGFELCGWAPGLGEPHKGDGIEFRPGKVYRFTAEEVP
jgi:hypothetical protein